MRIGRPLYGVVLLAAIAGLGWLWVRQRAVPEPALQPAPRGTTPVLSRPVPRSERAAPAPEKKPARAARPAAPRKAPPPPGLELTLVGAWKKLVVRLSRTEPPIEFNRNYPVAMRDGRGTVRIPLPSRKVSGVYLAVLAGKGHPIWEGRLATPPYQHLVRLPARDRRLVTLRGVVTDEQARPIEGAEAYARRFLGGKEYWRQTAVSSADGTFALADLLPGEYEVRVASKRHYQEWQKNLDLQRDEQLEIVFKTSYIQRFVVQRLDRLEKRFPGPYFLKIRWGMPTMRASGRKWIRQWDSEGIPLIAGGRAARALKRGMIVRVESLSNSRQTLEKWSGKQILVGTQNPYVVRVGGNTEHVQFVVKQQQPSAWAELIAARPGLISSISFSSSSDLSLLHWKDTKLIPLGRYVFIASTPGHRVIARVLEVKEGMPPVRVDFVADETVREQDLPRGDGRNLARYMHLMKRD